MRHASAWGHDEGNGAVADLGGKDMEHRAEGGEHDVTVVMPANEYCLQIDVKRSTFGLGRWCCQLKPDCRRIDGICGHGVRKIPMVTYGGIVSQLLR